MLRLVLNYRQHVINNGTGMTLGKLLPPAEGLGRSEWRGCHRLAFETGMHPVLQQIPGQRAIDHQHVAAIVVDHLPQGSAGECQGGPVPGTSQMPCKPRAWRY